MEEINWFHNIIFPDGTSTLGQNKEQFIGLLPSIDFKDKRVLDIGCRDGFYSFYSEKRGANEIISIDINDDQCRMNKLEGNVDFSAGYLYAHNKLKSKCKYIFPYSIYDIDKSKFGEFDLVLFLGVFYHLVHPALALERINEVMKINGMLYLETELSNNSTHFHSKNDVYSGDYTCFWIMHYFDFEKLMDFMGFEIVQKNYMCPTRGEYIFRKYKEFDKKYGYSNIYQEKEKKTNILVKK